jgi:hypothetical protein
MKSIWGGSLRRNLAIALTLWVGGYTCVALAQKTTTPNRFEIALIGDAPYSAQEESQYPNLTADINRSHVSTAYEFYARGDLWSSRYSLGEGNNSA